MRLHLNFNQSEHLGLIPNVGFLAPDKLSSIGRCVALFHPILQYWLRRAAMTGPRPVLPLTLRAVQPVRKRRLAEPNPRQLRFQRPDSAH